MLHSLFASVEISTPKKEPMTSLTNLCYVDTLANSSQHADVFSWFERTIPCRSSFTAFRYNLEYESQTVFDRFLICDILMQSFPVSKFRFFQL